MDRGARSTSGRRPVGAGDHSIRHRKWRRRRGASVGLSSSSDVIVVVVSDVIVACERQQLKRLSPPDRLIEQDPALSFKRSDGRQLAFASSRRRRELFIELIVVFHKTPPRKASRLVGSAPKRFGQNGRQNCSRACYCYAPLFVCSRRRFGQTRLPGQPDGGSRRDSGYLVVLARRPSLNKAPSWPSRSKLLRAADIETELLDYRRAQIGAAAELKIRQLTRGAGKQVIESVEEEELQCFLKDSPWHSRLKSDTNCRVNSVIEPCCCDTCPNIRGVACDDPTNSCNDKAPSFIDSTMLLLLLLLSLFRFNLLCLWCKLRYKLAIGASLRPERHKREKRHLSQQLNIVIGHMSNANSADSAKSEESIEKGQRATSTCQDQTQLRLLKLIGGFRGIISDKRQRPMACCGAVGQVAQELSSSATRKRRLYNSRLYCSSPGLTTLATTMSIVTTTPLKLKLANEGPLEASGQTAGSSVSKWWVKLITPVVGLVESAQFEQLAQLAEQQQHEQSSRHNCPIQVVCWHTLRDLDRLLVAVRSSTRSEDLRRYDGEIRRTGSEARRPITRGELASRRPCVMAPNQIRLQAKSGECSLLIHSAALTCPSRRRVAGAPANEDLAPVALQSAAPSCGLCRCGRTPTADRGETQIESRIPSCLTQSGQLARDGSAGGRPKCRLEVRRVGSNWLLAVRFSEPKRKRRQNWQTVQRDNKLTLTSCSSKLQIRDVRQYTGRMIANLDGLTIVVAIWRQLYDYICIDCEHCKQALFASLSPSCLGLGYVSVGLRAGNTEWAFPAVQFALTKLEIGPNATGIQCNGIIAVSNVSGTQSEWCRCFNSAAAALSWRSQKEPKVAKVCIGGERTSLNNNNGAGHSRPAHYGPLQCQCRHYHCYYYYYHYYRCNLTRASLCREAAELAPQLSRSGELGAASEQANKLITGNVLSTTGAAGAWPARKPLAKGKRHKQQQQALEQNGAGSNEDGKRLMARPRTCPADEAASLSSWWSPWSWLFGKPSVCMRVYATASWRMWPLWLAIAGHKSWPARRRKKPHRVCVALLLLLLHWLLCLSAGSGGLVRLAEANSSADLDLGLNLDTLAASIIDERLSSAAKQQRRQQLFALAEWQSGSRYKQTRARQLSANANERLADGHRTKRSVESWRQAERDLGNEFGSTKARFASSANQTLAKVGARKRARQRRRRLPSRKLNNDDGDDNNHAERRSARNNNDHNNHNSREAASIRRKVVALGSKPALLCSSCDFQLETDTQSAFGGIQDDKINATSCGFFTCSEAADFRRRSIGEPNEIKRIGRVETRNDVGNMAPKLLPPSSWSSDQLERLVSFKFDGRPNGSPAASRADIKRLQRPTETDLTEAEVHSSHEQLALLDTIGSRQARLAPLENNATAALVIGAGQPLAASDQLFWGAHFRAEASQLAAGLSRRLYRRQSASHRKRPHHLQQQQQQQQQHEGARLSHLGAMLPIMEANLSNELTAPSGTSRNCPSACQCVWKNGKQFADCSNHRHSLTQVPPGLDPLLQVLNISANYLFQLPDAAFVSLNLLNLQRIYMSSCQMESIQPRAFDKLKLVVELDFSWNRLNFVPVGQMRQLSLLRRLTMRGNPLYALNDTTLSDRPLPQLARAHSKQQLSTSTVKSAFEGLFAWRSLQSQDEELSLFKGSLFDSLSRLYETYPELVRSLVRQYTTLQLERENGQDRFKASPISKGEPSDRDSDRLMVAREFKILQRLLEQDQSDQSEAYEEAGEQDDDGGQSSSSSSFGNELDSDGNSPTSKFGAYFEHLQELDFGHCKLSYIKWTALEHFSQLKRLLLDGNQLSQLSGKLVGVLPVGLHQLSLEENPWNCDCRLAPLKRWLQTTRTPLSAPVRCYLTPWRDQFRRPLQQINQALTATKKRQHYSANSTSLTSNFVAREKDDNDDNNNNNISAGIQLDETDVGGNNKLTVQKHRVYRWQPVERIELFDQLALEDFVCAPRANLGAFSSGVSSSNVATKPAFSSASSHLTTTGAGRLGERVNHEHADNNDGDGSEGASEEQLIYSLRLLPSLNSVHEYLGHTLISYPNSQPEREPQQQRQAELNQTDSANNGTSSRSAAVASPIARQHKESVQVTEDDKVTLRCSFLAYPESSLDVVWLVDYNHRAAFSEAHHFAEAAGAGVPVPGRLPVEERFTVLYDSKLHRMNSTSIGNGLNDDSIELNQNKQQKSKAKLFTISEVSLYEARILIRETRSIDEEESIVKESQIIIQSAHVDDSARYKCIALNKAGNSSVEYLLRVVGQSSVGSSGSYIPSRDGTSLGLRNPAARDQRAQQASQQRNQHLEPTATNEAARVLAAQISQATSGDSNRSTGTSTTWLKSSIAFQITIVVVSALMAVVIIAFLLFCISIYQIKPTFPSSLLANDQSRPNHIQSQQWKDANGRTTLISSPLDQPLASLAGQQLVVGLNGRSTLEPNYASQTRAQPLYALTNQSTPLLAGVYQESAYGQTPVHHQQVLNQEPMSMQTTIKFIEDGGALRHANLQQQLILQNNNNNSPVSSQHVTTYT